MSYNVPEEILDCIVEIVARDKHYTRRQSLTALCLCNRALVSVAQKHLYRDLTIYINGGHIPPDQEDYYALPFQRVRRILETITRKPALCTHVERLVCEMTSSLEQDDQFVEDVCSALRRMSNVHDLSIVFKAPPHNPTTRKTLRISSFKNVSLGSTLSILSKMPAPRSFAIHNITGYPLELVPFNPDLRHLELRNAGFKTDYAVPNGSLQALKECRLRSITTDAVSLRELTTRLWDLPVGYRALDLSQLHKLDIGVGNTQIFRLAMKSAKCLEEIRMRAELTDNCLTNPSTEGGPVHPLIGLPPESFNTLTNLTIDIQHTQSEGRAITNPWGYDWRTAFRSLTRLQALMVHISIGGDISSLFDEETHTRWGALPRAIGPNSDGCPSLREFQLSLRLCVRDGEEVEKDTEIAQSFLENFTTVTYPVHILPARDAEKEGRALSFTFKAEIAVGDLVQTSSEERYN